MITDEVLTAVDKSAGASGNWSPYQLTENRLSVYYRRTFLGQKIALDFGIVHQYWRDKPGILKFNTS